MDFELGKLALQVERQQRRIEILERAIVLMLSSSRAYKWIEGSGIEATEKAYNDEVAQMILGYSEWNPSSLDKGG